LRYRPRRNILCFTLLGKYKRTIKLLRRDAGYAYAGRFDGENFIDAAGSKEAFELRASSEKNRYPSGD
jgi:hypothetical protein